jgi:hypothetical protein
VKASGTVRGRAVGADYWPKQYSLYMLLHSPSPFAL